MKTTIFYLSVGALLFAGCSTISQNEALDPIKQLKINKIQNNIQWVTNKEEEVEVQSIIGQMLISPLSLENAIRISLINNPQLQQAYSSIGIAQSDLVQAGLLNNPLLGYSVAKSGGASSSTVSIEFSFLDLLWIPVRKELSGLALEEVQLEVGNNVLETVKNVKIAYINAFIAEQKIKEFESILKSSEVAAQLAMRQYSSGNLPKRDYLLVYETYLKDRLEMMELNKAQTESRESLNRLLGLHGAQTNFIFNQTITIDSLENMDTSIMENTAINRRLDVAAAKKRVEYDGTQAGYTVNMRLLSEATVTFERESASGESSAIKTLGAKISLPIFDYGQAKTNLAKTVYIKSMHRLYETTINAKSQVREAYAKARFAQDIMQEQKNHIVPVKTQILEETQKNYNGMLDDAGILLDHQRELARAKIGLLEKNASFESAYYELEYTLGGFDGNQ